MMLREMLLSRVRWRDFARSSRNSRAFSSAMTASLASTRIISRWPASSARSWGLCTDHGADGPLVQQQGHAAEASFVRILRFEAQLAHFFGVIFADQDGLARAHQIFNHVVAAKWPGPFGLNFAVAHLDFKSNFVAGRYRAARRRNGSRRTGA